MRASTAWRAAAYLGLGAVLGIAAPGEGTGQVPEDGQAGGAPAETPVLVGGDLEVSWPNEGGEVTVRVIYTFEAGTGSSVEVLFTTLGKEMNTPKWFRGEEAQEIRFDWKTEGTLSGTGYLDGDQLILMYQSLDAYSLGGEEVAFELPIPVPVGAAGTAMAERFTIRLYTGVEYAVESPFPSNLRMEPNGEGSWVIRGDAPAVPSVVRFGHSDRVGSPMEPREPLGWMFWGLWVALGAVLVGYLVWMMRRERGGGVEA